MWRSRSVFALGVIARREFMQFWLTPMGWVVAAVTLGLLSYAFLAQVDGFLRVQGKLAALPDGPGLTDLIVIPFFGNAASVLLLVVPVVTMRLFSDEQRYQTLTLLLAAPISATQLVLGKYCGAVIYLGVLVLGAAAMPLTLFVGGHIDVGVWCAGVLALVCLIAVGAAVGIYMSSLTVQAVVAAVSTFGLLLLFWMLDWQGETAGEATALRYFSLLNHLRPLISGKISAVDIGFFVALTALFLGLTVWRMSAVRDA